MGNLDKMIWRATDGVILVAVLGMVALIALQVGSRLAGVSVPWTEELSRFLFIWTIWMGLAASFRTGAHASIQLIPETAPRALRMLMRAAQLGACVVLFTVVTWHGLHLLAQQVRFGEQSPILQVGMWWATLPLVLGSGLAIIGAIIESLRPLDAAPATDPLKDMAT